MYYYNLGNSSQHQVMANNLIDAIANPLKNLYPNPTISSDKRDSIYNALAWGGVNETSVFRVKTDAEKLYITAINTMARDTSLHAPFILNGNSNVSYPDDSHTTNMKKGCQ